MPQVVTFRRERPPARADGIPFTNAVISEAPASTGPWTVIDTVALDGPDVIPSGFDTNPNSPLFRTITTSLGTGPDLWYTITYTDAFAGESLPTDPVQNTEPPATGDGTGPCTDWLTGADVALCCDTTASTDSTVFDDVATQAQELLFSLSGRVFAGVCEKTVRPCRTRCGFGFQVLSRGHIVGGWQGNAWWYDGTPCGCRPLSRVKLSGYPVRDILEVKIDGDIVDPATYRLDRKRYLVRMRDPADLSMVLTWPACQSLDLDDTETGTFSITYTYGQDVPVAGVAAAAELACELYKACQNLPCALPRNVTRASRQGLTIEKPAFVSWGFQSGRSRGLPRGWNTGLPNVDAFLNAYAPDGVRRRPVFWSPAVTHQYPLVVDS